MKNRTTQMYNTPYQLKLPPEIEKIIEISDPVYIFCEVLNNLNSTKGALLRMNRSIQTEGAFGTIKWNRDYKRARRKGLKGVILNFP